VDAPKNRFKMLKFWNCCRKKKKRKVRAGTSWSYSNSGYVMLGLIVAKASRKSYGDFLHERIFAPLKMNHTIVFQKGKNEITNRALATRKKMTLQENRSEFDVRDAWRWGYLFESRRSRQVG